MYVSVLCEAGRLLCIQWRYLGITLKERPMEKKDLFFSPRVLSPTLPSSAASFRVAE